MRLSSWSLSIYNGEHAINNTEIFKNPKNARKDGGFLFSAQDFNVSAAVVYSYVCSRR